MITLAAYMLIVGVVMLAALLLAVGFQMLRGRVLGAAAVMRALAPRARSLAAGEAERQASAAAEALQAIVQRHMTADPAFAGQSLDFGTAPDGSVEVWLNGQAYAGVDRIPDPRLRELIARSADEFNRGDAAPR
jgi:hypothetical protein